MKSVCVYCGSLSGNQIGYAESAEAFGWALVKANLSLVYGGAKTGLMGALADAVLAAGGNAIGVIPELLIDEGVGHLGLTELHVVADMHERKRKMADLADAFVALPGGIGTLEEFFEVFTWAQLGYHQKPVALLNVNRFYDPLLAMLQHTANEGFMEQFFIEMLQIDANPLVLLERLATYKPPIGNKWSKYRSAV